MAHVEAAAELVQACARPADPTAHRNREPRRARSPTHPLGAALTRAHVARCPGRVMGKHTVVIGAIEACTSVKQARTQPPEDGPHDARGCRPARD